MVKEYDIIIIGGGILGCSLAYYLSKNGKKVIVLEQNEICSGTSSATAALVLPSPKTPKHYTQISWEGYERMKGLTDELGKDIELQITSSTMLCRTEDARAGMMKTVEINQELGRDVRWLTPEEIVSIEPVLNPAEFVGGVRCEDSGNVNPFLLVNAYAQAAKGLGADIETFAPVTGFEIKGRDVTLVHTGKGDYRGNQIICAAGNGSISIGKMISADPHIKNTRGLIMVSEKLPPLLHSTYAQMRQAKSGNLIMGANFRNMETGDTDRRVHYDEMMEVAADIAALAPSLKTLKIIRMYSGIRILPEDGLPIAGKTAEYDNFWFYLMHSAFSASPEFSYRLALILCGKMDMEALREYDYARFCS